MSFRNSLVASGVVAVSAPPGTVDYVAIQVLVAGNITFTDSKGNVTALTAVPAGTRIDARIINISVLTATILGYIG